jgi:hypothetical protein
MTRRGDLALLHDPVAQEMLCSTEPARLAYSWTDGTQRVVPIGFHWDGTAMFFGTQPYAPKIRALSANPTVAVTVDTNTFPYHVLLLRGTVEIEVLDDVVPEYELAVVRYVGRELASSWLQQFRGKPMARIRFEPAWASVIDFETRFPSAMD